MSSGLTSRFIRSHMVLYLTVRSHLSFFACVISSKSQEQKVRSHFSSEISVKSQEQNMKSHFSSEISVKSQTYKVRSQFSSEISVRSHQKVRGQ